MVAFHHGIEARGVGSAPASGVTCESDAGVGQEAYPLRAEFRNVLGGCRIAHECREPPLTRIRRGRDVMCSLY